MKTSQQVEGSTPPVTTETHDEWRIYGSRPNYGPWAGEWKRGEPDARAMYDVRQAAKRNDEVWLQRRSVTTVTQRAERVTAGSITSTGEADLAD